MYREDGNFLLIVGAHQDSSLKLSHVLNLLSYLKSEKIDVCFSTHSHYGLDKIAEVCNFVAFDSDNSLITPNDLINNIESVEADKLSDRWVEWYNVLLGQDTTYLKSFISGAPHQKSALKIVKNGLDVAKANSYEWVGYLEYDFAIPVKSFRSIIDRIINKIKQSKKRSFILWRDLDTNFMYGGFFVCMVDLLAENHVFNSDWHSSKKLWLQTFGNRFFETSLEEFLNPQGEDICVIERKDDFFLENWGTLEKGLNMFTFDDSIENIETQRIKLSNYFILSFYVGKIGNEYTLEVWAYNKHPSWNFEILDFSLVTPTENLNIEKESLSPGGWYNIKNIGIVDVKEELEFSLSYFFRNAPESQTYLEKQTIRSGDLEKIYRIRRKEFQIQLKQKNNFDI